ncbi:MAG TPA: Gfo/Idh/MocA family oxidoreductase [Bryobacteraceae bacterium]|nr:Gfo/Idh/MocA family oxidoreductase [Bryobacteraceae bacterium]
MNGINRRDFARTATLATALSYSRILGANDRVQLGYIGVGNRGDQDHDAFLENGGNETVAVCDLRDDYMDFAVKKSRANPKKYKEYRDLLADKNVDAVVIATPDHWHALMFVDACHAGKDVYVEKPLSLTVVEGRKMVETAERTKRVTQVGTQRRSSPFLKEAAEFVRSGGIGPVTMVSSSHIENQWPNGIGNPPDGSPPSEWEWDHWLGPAPMVPYNKNREFYKFRWFYNYSGGQLTNYGVHNVDMLRWCLGQDAPRSVAAMGGKYAIRDNREIPDTLQVMWEWDGPTLMLFTHHDNNDSAVNAQGAEMELRGTKGTMYIHGNRWEVVPQKITDMPYYARTPVNREQERAYRPSKKAVIEPKVVRGTESTVLHARNFLECIKSRAKCNADVLIGHLSTSSTLIGNVALKTQSLLKWDAHQERFTNNEAANRFLQYKYRAPYKLG